LRDSQRVKRPSAKARKKIWRYALLGLVLLGALILVRSTDWLAAFGGRLEGDRLARVHASPHYAGDRFQNPVPTRKLTGSWWEMLKRQFLGSELRAPEKALPIAVRRREDFAVLPGSGLRATWIGHSTVFVEIDGHRLLFDPIWSERGSPSTLVGPRRFHPAPLPLEELPRIDAVIITHDHYDHLDMATIRQLIGKGPVFLVPLGVGAHLEKWGVPRASITELDWGERQKLGSLTATATPARHFSGRGIADGDSTLWASWVVAGVKHRIFVSGDTGYFDGFRRIGAEHGPFDLTVLKVGAYGSAWPEIHVTPEEAVQAHLDLRGKVLLPVHWGTFNLAYHAWYEPAERAVLAAAAQRVVLVVPRPGDSVEPSSVPSLVPWWRERTVAQ
jgi:L-ascorbate metabolism protein UlaG (beta-lactamase superfamily)